MNLRPCFNPGSVFRNKHGGNHMGDTSQDRLAAELRRLLDINGRDAAWVSENFGNICALLLNAKTAVDRPLIEN